MFVRILWLFLWKETGKSLEVWLDFGLRPKFSKQLFGSSWEGTELDWTLAHQNRTIAIASDFRVDGAKSPEIPQKEGVLGSEIAARNRKSLATFHRTLKSQCSIAFSCRGNRAISGVRDGHRNRKSQKSLRFRCTKDWTYFQQFQDRKKLSLSTGCPSGRGGGLERVFLEVAFSSYFLGFLASSAF